MYVVGRGHLAGGRRHGAPWCIPCLILLLLAGLWVVDVLVLGEVVAQEPDDIPMGVARPAPTPPTRPLYVRGEAIVKFAPALSTADRTGALNAAGVTLIRHLLLPGYALVSFGLDEDVGLRVKALGQAPGIAMAEPNYYAFIDSPPALAPNDPYYSFQWHFPQIQMSSAWNLSCGSGVTVAVIDTGVAYENFGSYSRAPDLASTNFVAGYDFINGDAHPNDDHGHGTHVAGTIAQSTNNAIGVAGVAYCASIMPVKVLDSSGSGTSANVVDGITWAVNNGAKVLNLSLGGSAYSSSMQAAVTNAYDNGRIVIAAMGNNDSSTPFYPAALTNVIAVGAIRYDETRSYYSNYGSHIAVVAPGGDVTVDQNGDGYGDGVLQQTFYHVCGEGTPDYGSFVYCFFQGTSMAAPHVTGVAALLVANGTASSPDHVRQALQNTAKDLGAAGWDQYYGWGLVQAYDALNMATRLFYLPFLPKSDTGVGTAADPSASTINFIVQNLSSARGSFFTGFQRLSDGARLFGTNPQALEPGRSAAVVPSGLSGLASGSYSVVLTSTHSLGVVANGHAGNGSAYSYTAPAIFSTTIYFPNLNRNLGSEQWNTPFFIQNADTAATSNLAVRFYQVPEGTLLKELTGLSLSPGQSRRFNPATEAGLTDGLTFSVVASASAKLAGVAFQYSASDGGLQLLASAAFASGGTTVYLPNLNTQLGTERWTTPFLIQNIGSVSTDLTIQYFHVPSGALHKTVSYAGLLPGRSYVGLPHQEAGLTSGSIYSAVVASSGQPVVGLIQQHGEQGQALNHNAFNGGSTRVYCPNLNTNLGAEQWNTPAIIQNVGSGATNLTISYYRSGTGTLDKVVSATELQSGRAHVALPHQEAGLTPNSGYAAVIESSSQPIVALVNQHGSLSGDQNLGNECLSS